jgi:ribosomal protein L40E
MAREQCNAEEWKYECEARERARNNRTCERCGASLGGSYGIDRNRHRCVSGFVVVCEKCYAKSKTSWGFALLIGELEMRHGGEHWMNRPAEEAMPENKIQKVVSVVESEGKDALWRTAALKLVDVAKVPIRTTLAPRLPKPIGDLLDTQYGEAALAYALGVGLASSPWSADAKAKRLAYELRVYGMTVLSSRLFDVVFVPIKDAVADILKALPEAE